MIRNKSLRYALLLALGVFLTTSVNAQQAQPGAAKAAKPAKTGRPRRRRPRASPGGSPSAPCDLLKAASEPPGGGPLDEFHGGGHLRESEPPRPAARLHDESEVTLQRPDKLRVITPGDGPASEFYYDGKTMMAFAPAENLVAVAEAPPTIDAALKAAYDAAAIYFPFTDLIVADPYRAIADGLKLAFYIGQSNVVGDTTTDMVAIASDVVFVQIWIGADDKLPRMMRAVYRDDPLRLRHQMDSPTGSSTASRGRLRVVERRQRDAHRVRPSGGEAPAGAQANAKATKAGPARN